MRKVLLIVNLLLFSVPVVWSQTELTSGLIANPGFEEGTIDWQLDVNGSTLANFSISSNSAVGSSAAKVEVIKGEETHLVILKNSLSSNISNYAGKNLIVSVKVKVMQIIDGNNIILRVNFFDGTGNVMSNKYVQTQFWNNSFSKGKFVTLSQYQIVPQNAEKIQIELWCGREANTYYFDDIKVIDNSSVEENNLEVSEHNVLNVVMASGGRSVFNTREIQKITFSEGELILLDSNGTSHFFDVSDILSLNFRKYPVLTALSRLTHSPEEDLILYPNPAADRLYFSGEFVNKDEFHVEILTLDGKILLTKENISNEKSISISGISSGVYICRIFSREKVSSSIFMKK